MSSGVNPVPTFDDLKEQLSSELKIVNERQRDRLVREIMQLAKRKLAKEKREQWSEDQVPQIRASMAKFKRILTPIINAIKELEKANKIAGAKYRSILKGYQVLEARNLLVMAARDLLYEKDHIYPASIATKLRNSKDRKTRFPLQWTDGSNYLHQFIQELDTRLSTFVGPDGKKLKVGRDQLIRKVCADIFQQNLAKTTIERIRNRKI